MGKKYNSKEIIRQAFLLDKINGQVIEPASQELTEKILKQNKNEIVGYIRTASKDYSEIRIEKQKEFILRFCEEYDVRCQKIFIDDGFSGKNLDRPGIKEICKAKNIK